MVIFFKTSVQNIIAVQADHSFSADETKKLSWLFDNAELLPASTLKGWFIGPRKEMITPWSTNAVEITQNMGLTGISRIEEFFPVTDGSAEFDKMLQRLYKSIPSTAVIKFSTVSSSSTVKKKKVLFLN